jgi:hypothetical protein
VIGVLERDALFARTGHGGIAQVGTRGAVAACFDHWDTRGRGTLAIARSALRWQALVTRT